MLPAEFWKSETVTDEQRCELCKIAVEQTGLALKSVPVEILFRENSFELSDNGQALLSGVFLNQVVTNCHPKFAYCLNRDAYLSLMKSLSQRSSLPFYILGDSDMLCSESRAILESGGTDRPVYLFLKMDSKYNALLESFKFEFEMGQFITLHKTVQVIILAEDRDRFSNDVFSRCHEEYEDPMLSWFKLNPAKLDVTSSTKALECEDIAVDSIPDSVRVSFNTHPTIIDPLILAGTFLLVEMEGYLRELQDNDCVVVQTVEGVQLYAG